MKNNEEIIYIKESDVPITRTRKQLIRYFLRGKSIPTYKDKNFCTLQCDGKGDDTGINAFRSITDLLAITRSRFPKTSIEGLVKIIHEFIEEDKAVVMIWCTQINKVVLKYYNNANSVYMTKYSIRNYFTKKGVDDYSLEDYSNMIN